MGHQRYNILYVDDEQSNLRVFKTIYRHYYNIYTVISAEEAFVILENNPVHLIISDQRMPEMTGVEFLKEVKKKWPEPKCILLTAYSDHEVLKKAINVVGIWRYINKPYDHDDLRSVMDNALEAYQLKIDKDILNDELEIRREKLEEMVYSQKLILENIDEIIYQAVLSKPNELSDQKLIYLSPQVEKVTGYKAIEFIYNPKLWNKRIHSEDNKSITSNQKGILINKKIIRYYRFQNKNGKYIWLEDKANAQVDKDGNTVGLFGTVRDISVAKNSEEEKSKLVEQLITRNKDLQDFGNIVSHNFRAPIATILDLNNSIDTNNLSGENLKFVKMIKREANKLDSVIEDLSKILAVRESE